MWYRFMLSYTVEEMVCRHSEWDTHLVFARCIGRVCWELSHNMWTMPNPYILSHAPSWLLYTTVFSPGNALQATAAQISPAVCYNVSFCSPDCLAHRALPRLDTIISPSQQIWKWTRPLQVKKRVLIYWQQTHIVKMLRNWNTKYIRKL